MLSFIFPWITCNAFCPHFPTLGARDFSSAVSGFCQVFIVTRAKSGFFSRLRCSWLRPTAEAVSAFSRQVPPHARQTSGTQGTIFQGTRFNYAVVHISPRLKHFQSSLIFASLCHRLCYSVRNVPHTCKRNAINDIILLLASKSSDQRKIWTSTFI